MPTPPEQLREALARWPSGVTIVTGRVGERIHGMTVSAFCSVSLEPPLVLVCADQASNTHAVIREGGVFAVNVLGRDQEALSNKFASRRDEWRRFEGLDWEAGATGAPLIPGAIVQLDCRVHAAHEAGDHVIYVGEVQEARRRQGAALVYGDRAYGSFEPGD